jgi:GNAT superfamily N-acetyltransferase
MFKNHHYLNHKIPFAVRCFIAKWGDETVGFASSICLPGRTPPLYEGDVRLKWRECRTVCLPDFQGIGIGTRLSDAVADIHIEQGLRYFSKTSHIRMGEYRQKSPLWRPTATNLVDRSKSGSSKNWHHFPLEKKRICYSHEYIGENRKSYDPKWNEVYKQSKLERGIV